MCVYGVYVDEVGPGPLPYVERSFVINIKRTYLFRLCLRKNLSFEPSLLIIYAAMFHILLPAAADLWHGDI